VWFLNILCGGLPVVAETETKRRFKIYGILFLASIYLFFMNMNIILFSSVFCGLNI
jgi:hypothetical protein